MGTVVIKCSLCKDRGFVAREIGPNQWTTDFCPLCSPRSGGLKPDGLPAHMRSWETRTTVAYDWQVDALNVTCRAVMGRPFTHAFLAYYGPNGTGKTHTLAVACNLARQIGVQAYYWNVGILLEEFKATFGAKDSSRRYQELWDAVREVPILCLDEFLRYQETPWSVSLLERLIEYRYKPGRFLTLFAFNGDLTPATVGNYLYSRLRDAENSAAFYVAGYDLRLIGAEK